MQRFLASWRLNRAVRRSDSDHAALVNEVRSLRDSLEQERVRSRLLQVEIDLLAAINARNLERWSADLKVKDEA